MNDKTKLGISIVVVTGIVGHTLLDSIKIRRQEQAKRQQIKDDLDLDLTAIRRAKQRVMEEVKEGKHNHLSVDEMLRMINNRIEFERITIRMED